MPRWGQTKCRPFCRGQIVEAFCNQQQAGGRAPDHILVACALTTGPQESPHLELHGSLRNRKPISPIGVGTQSSTGRYEIESPFRRLVPEHTGPQEPHNLEIDGSLRNPTPHNKNVNAPLRLNAEGPFRRLSGLVQMIRVLQTFSQNPSVLSNVPGNKFGSKLCGTWRKTRARNACPW